MKNKDKQLVILEEEAKAVREIFDLFVVQKKNAQQIADYLKAMNILPPLPSSIHYGKRKPGITKINEPYFWRNTTVRDILKDEIYIWLYYYNKNEGNKRVERSKWVLSPFRHNPIIDRSVYSLAQRRIEEEISLRNSQKSLDNQLYLLSGLVKYHTFYDAYSGREPLNWFGTSKKKDGKRMYYYSCGGKNGKKHSTICPAIPFPAEEIERSVSEFIKDLLNDPESVCMHVDLLESTKANKKHLERLQKHVIDELNGIPERN